MATKMKDIIRSFKFISQIFANHKEHEMEIGHPTDVKHVSHVGWDGSSVNPPTWMNDYKTSPEFVSPLLSNLSRESNTAGISSWSSQDFQQCGGLEPISGIFADCPPDLPKVPKKMKRKKTKTSSSPSPPRSSRRSSKSKGRSFTLDDGEGMLSLVDTRP